MKTCNRDLLVLVKDEHMNERSMELELEQLNDLLFQFETIDSFCVAHEVFDINKHKTLYRRAIMQKIVREKELKPFIFICNKN
jgi:predicted Zn-dependent protease with MMP-like domain